MAGSEQFTCKDMIQALQDTKGMVYLAAKRLGCSHTTVYNYIKRHPTVKEAWEAEHGVVGDNAELALYSAILKGEHWAVTFYLRTKGKDRGYTERTEQEITGKDGGPVEHKITEVVVELPTDEPVAD